jgi:septal ring factor EnvC (AmiA/AmiB activator)
VVAAALTDRVAVAQDEPAALGAGDLPLRSSLQPRARGWRVHAGWLVAAALGTMFMAGIVVFNRTQETARQQAIAAEQVSVAAEENAKLKKQLEEAQQKVDALIDQLAVASTDDDRAELKRKIEEEKARQYALKGRAAGGGPPAAKTKPACKCQPNDPLCSCL